MAGELLTERVRLRRWSLDDLEELTRIFAEPEVWRFPFGRGFSAQETEGFLARRIQEQEGGAWVEWAAEHRASGRLIGYIGFSEPHFLPELLPTVEVGWRLDPAAWGQGLATEGARASLTHGFAACGLEQVVSIYQPENTASGRIMERLGMRFDRDTRHPGTGLSLRVFRLSRAEWEAMQTGGDTPSG